MEFDRKGKSLEDGVISAIKNVKSTTVNAEVASVAPENLVTEAEISKRLNKNKQTVSSWIKGARRKSFPHPIMHVSEKSPLWNWSEVSWLFREKLLTNKAMVEEALFFANINAALEERDRKTRIIRHNLLERISI